MYKSHWKQTKKINIFQAYLVGTVIKLIFYEDPNLDPDLDGDRCDASVRICIKNVCWSTSLTTTMVNYLATERARRCSLWRGPWRTGSGTPAPPVPDKYRGQWLIQEFLKDYSSCHPSKNRTKFDRLQPGPTWVRSTDSRVSRDRTSSRWKCSCHESNHIFVSLIDKSNLCLF